MSADWVGDLLRQDLDPDSLDLHLRLELAERYEAARAEILASWPSQVLRDISWVGHDAGVSAAYRELQRRDERAA